jgi:hypothetical protein
MTHFLARLVERARGTAPRVAPIIASRFAPADSKPVIDSFADATDAEAARPSLTPLLDIPSQVASDHAPIESPVSISKGVGGTKAAEIGEVSPRSLEPDDQFAFRPGSINTAERLESASRSRAPKRVTITPKSRADRSRTRSDKETRPTTTQPTLVPQTARTLVATRAVELFPDKSRASTTEARTQESTPLRPRGKELLDIADGFMDELRPRAPKSPVLQPVKASKNSSALPLRESPWDERPSSRRESVDSAGPSVHIGSVRVEIVEPSTRKAEPTPAPAPRIVVRGAKHILGTRATPRQWFGLRQL